ncbi:thioredoxin family protein [Reyranella sp.]|jgi:small redox-active disulfide protein 2|uniref:thioredoxin family protein n=1 Tax=Reyranella sp. TaxID=1929291 RepID=UPI000BD4E81A|nr:thioredoxin family protein [Reyranella sp.]OYW84419.1 MAG: thioredoxin family protein [Sphingobium sp. 32-64-5]OYY40113.1 MAG: thioredoxin family protein [Rhodospirillales bacterium 35-66-84]OYZ92522.1 MAG: thioredoxin family protein [Rhodospirillales bacterium 24-66-33]OZB23830.1 MAG: thioredoxin family protein [Rhodospirillales bacterium 39-66-50]HQS16992.1 thioredoxin family protein [Reyranella sp.]
MKEVKILGPGCKRCDAAAEMVKAEAAKLGIEVTVEKVTDYAAIAGYGIASTPGIVVEGKVVHAGGLPRQEAIAGWLKA